MKVKLLKDARIRHKAGEIVEVSPEECFFLTSTGRKDRNARELSRFGEDYGKEEPR